MAKPGRFGIGPAADRAGRLPGLIGRNPAGLGRIQAGAHFFWIGSRWLFESAGLGPAWRIMETLRAMKNHVFSGLVREGFGGAPKSIFFITHALKAINRTQPYVLPSDCCS